MPASLTRACAALSELISGMTFTLAITSPASTFCPASLRISVMMPEIWGLTFTSLRGSIFPVTTVVLRMSICFGSNSLYSTGFGCDLM